MRFRHISYGIEGMLLLREKELRELATNATDDNGNQMTFEAFKQFLLDEKALGHKFLPVTGCNNFDPVKGCLGHEASEIFPKETESE